MTEQELSAAELQAGLAAVKPLIDAAIDQAPFIVRGAARQMITDDLILTLVVAAIDAAAEVRNQNPQEKTT